RALLARRLTRHCFTASGGALLATLLQDEVSACVPTALVHHTVSAATALVAGQTAAAGAVSAQVAALMEGVLKTMLVTKLKITAGVLLLGLLGIIASAGGWATWAAEQPRPEPLADPAPRRAEEGKYAADSTEASALLPTGPMPIPFLVRVDSDDQLVTTRKVTIHQPVTEESPDGKPVTYYKAIETLTTERFELARTKLVVYNTRGKTIELKALPRLLRKETVAMLLAAGQRIDVRLLRLFKEDTLFF